MRFNLLTILNLIVFLPLIKSAQVSDTNPSSTAVQNSMQKQEQLKLLKEKYEEFLKIKNEYIKSPDGFSSDKKHGGIPIFHPKHFEYYENFISGISNIVPEYTKMIEKTLEQIFYCLAEERGRVAFQFYIQWNYIYKKRMIAILVVLEKIVKIFELANDPINVLEEINLLQDNFFVSLLLSDIEITSDTLTCIKGYLDNKNFNPNFIMLVLHEYFNKCEIEEISAGNKIDNELFTTNDLNESLNKKTYINKEIVNFERDELKRNTKVNEIPEKEKKILLKNKNFVEAAKRLFILDTDLFHTFCENLKINDNIRKSYFHVLLEFAKQQGQSLDFEKIKDECYILNIITRKMLCLINANISEDILIKDIVKTETYKKYYDVYVLTFFSLIKTFKQSSNELLQKAGDLLESLNNNFLEELSIKTENEYIEIVSLITAGQLEMKIDEMKKLEEIFNK